MDDRNYDLFSKRQEQMISFWQCFEGIRWRFTSAFGVGAIAALFFSQSNLSQINTILSLAVLFGLSIASVFIQLRVYGILLSLWKKIIRLQQIEVNNLENSSTISSLPKEYKRALYFPQPISSKYRLLSVTGVTCSVFIVLAGIAVYLFTSAYLSDYYPLTALIIFITLGLVAVSYALGAVARSHYESLSADDIRSKSITEI